MLAAIRDNASYLATTPQAPLLTPAVRATVGRIIAVIANHPDPMTDPRHRAATPRQPPHNPPFHPCRQNPDIAHWNVTATAVMVVTGSRDYIEPTHSAWQVPAFRRGRVQG
jgi:hypothetical protein